MPSKPPPNDHASFPSVCAPVLLPVVCPKAESVRLAVTDWLLTTDQLHHPLTAEAVEQRRLRVLVDRERNSVPFG